jgi:serine/threonine protein kinase
MTLTPGTRLGPYEIVSVLGAGAMGEVYRARDPRLGRDVAIKIVLGSVATNPVVRDRFEREARAVAALAHPNILAVFDVGSEGDVEFVVTELLQGHTLRRRLAESGALAPKRALELAVQIAGGLAAAHERGIVHRDLKPENLFVVEDGRVKILDFGLARRESPEGGAGLEMTVAATQPGMFVGTAGYASPEQVEGAPATPRSDLFALGIVMHEMLTGRHPFERPTAYETLAAILRDDPPPLDAVAGLPTGIASAIERCLAKRPADRPGSAGDLAFLLETLGRRGETSIAVVCYTWSPARSFCSSSRSQSPSSSPAHESRQKLSMPIWRGGRRSPRARVRTGWRACGSPRGSWRRFPS